MDDTTWESWQLQNLYFGENAHVLAQIANIPSNGDMAIRKQIEGRAWNDSDTFTFDIAFRKNDGKILDDESISLANNSGSYGIPDSNAVRISSEEYNLFNEGSLNSLGDEVKKYLNEFNSGNIADITVNNKSENAQDIISVHGMQENVKVALPDTKQSVPLIVNGEVTYGSDGKPAPENQQPKDALMNTSVAGSAEDYGVQMPVAHEFPAAGTYTFTVSENSGGPGTTDYTSRVYTIVVQVTRVLDPGATEPVTRDNSYLHAEVQSMHYQEIEEGKTSTGYSENYGSKVYYAGVAPTFTNRYHIQPAVQSTSYGIQVNFKGRLDENGQPINKGQNTENWLKTDKFTATITGDDDETKTALRDGNIYIGGLLGNPEHLHEQKRIDFNQTNVVNGYPENGNETDKVEKPNEHIFRFEELDFRDIEFPVKWEFTKATSIEGNEYNIGDEVPPADEELGTNIVILLSQEEAELLSLDAGYYLLEDAEYRGNLNEHISALHPVASRTEDVVYNLTIKMEPEENNGITYDANVYSMKITLKNSANGGTNTDGIIDEMDLVVSKKGTDGTVREEEYATCETDQHVVTSFDNWTNPEGYFNSLGSLPTLDSGDTVKYLQYYVNADGVIREVEVAEDSDGHKHYYVSIPGTSGEQTRIEIVNDEPVGDVQMTFNNLADNGVTFIIKREVHSGNHIMVFDNEYATKGTWTPTINKTLSGRDWQLGETFDFELACTEWPGMGAEGAPNYTYNPLKNNDGTAAPAQKITINKGSGTDNKGTGSFGDITFTAPGKYTFTIAETNKGMGLGKGSMTSDGDIEITVTADDDDNGHLNLIVTGEEGTIVENAIDKSDDVDTTISFVNAYTEEGTFQIKLEKTLTGRAWNADESFSFTVTPDDAAKEAINADPQLLTVPSSWDINEDDTYTVTVAAPDSSAVSSVLGELELGNHRTSGATYVFSVKENTESFEDNDIYCSQPEIKLTVVVTSATDLGGYTGALLTYAYLGETDTGHIDEPYTVPFTNRYYVDTDAPGGEGDEQGFTIAKSFTGRQGNDWLSSDSFSAHVVFDGANSIGNLENVFYKGPSDEAYAAIGSSGFSQTVNFTNTDRVSKDFDFRFFEAGRYVFTVTETEGDIAGVTYDTNTYTVTFDVILNTDNTLEIKRTITRGESEEVPGGTITFYNTYEATGTWTPTVTKTLNGRDWQENEEFRFTLSCTEESGVELPDSTTIEIGKDDVTNGVPFGAVKFTKPGTYHFTIEETGTGLGLGQGGIDPVQGKIEITVTAADNGDGTMKLDVTGDGGTPLPSTTNDGTSDVKTTVSFVNTYTESGEFAINIAKTLTGRPWTNADAFKFTIEPDEDTKVAINANILTVSWTDSDESGAYSATVTGEENGSATQSLSLGTVSVSGQNGESKSYTFTITEDTTGFETRELYCAQPKITLTVTVKPKMESGRFTGNYEYSATYAYLNDSDVAGSGNPVSDPPISVPFTNHAAAVADPSSPNSSLTIRKVIAGRSWLAGESYTVALSLTSNNAENVQYSVDSDPYHGLPMEMTRTFSSSDGSAPADWILNFRFYAEGTYTFAVKEEEPASLKPGITCDDRTYTVTYTVATVGGRLTVTSRTDNSGTETDDGIVAVTNTYTPKPATWTPSITKRMNGRTWLPNDEFTFELALASDSPAQEGITGVPGTAVVKSREDHMVSFDPVTFKGSGNREYKFTIRETGTEPSITAGTYTITVKVTDDTAAGELKLSFEEPESIDPTEEKTDGGWQYATNTEFVNTYSQKPGQFTLNIQKTLSGRPWKEGESYTFTITPDEAARAAISSSEGEPSMVLPNSWIESGDAYTVTVTNTGGAAAGGVINQSLGSVQVKEAGTYGFTIAEMVPTDGDTYCPESEIVLTVRAMPETNEHGIDTGNMLVTTYAHTAGGGSLGHDPNNDTTVVPFTNYAYAGTELTLNKTYTNSADSSEREWTNGLFQAEVTLDTGDGQVTYGGAPLVKGRAVTVPLTKDGAKTSFRFLAEGDYTFTVEEVHGHAPGVTYDISRYTAAVTVTADDTTGVLTAAAPVIQKDGEDATEIRFNNTYTDVPVTGGLTISKTVAGEEGETDREWDFTVTLTGEGAEEFSETYDGVSFESGKAEFTLHHDQSRTFVGLPAGLRYTVTETEADTDGYTTTATGARGVVPREGTAAVHFVNTKGEVSAPDENTGSLTVTKTVAGMAGETDREWNFTVTLSDTDFSGVSDGVTFNGGKAEFTLKHDESRTFTGLPAGADYTVAETEANTDGYVTSFTGENGTIREGATATALFVNSRERVRVPTGSLTVTKIVAGTETETSREWNFTVTLKDTENNPVTGTFGGVEFAGTGTASLVLKHDESRMITGLPVGTKYAVEETEANQDGYTTTAIGVTGIIEENVTAEAVFNNIKNSDPGSGKGFLTVTKTVTGNAGERNKNFEFTVTLSEDSLNQVIDDVQFTNGKGIFTLSHGQSKTFELPANTGYMVEETAAEGYSTTAINEEGTVPDGAAAAASFVNNRTIPVGNLEVVKTVTGELGDTDKEWHFRVELGRSINGRYGDMTFEDGVATFVLKHGGSAAALNLPAGVAYTVTEEEANAGGYTTAATGADEHIPANDTIWAEFVNNRPAPPPSVRRYGELVVSKTVTGEAGEKDREWHFRVSLNQKIDGTYGDMTFRDGAAEFTLKDGQSAAARSLPEGVGYTVTETEANADGYTTAATGGSGTIPANSAVEARFENHRDSDPEEASGTPTPTPPGDDKDDDPDDSPKPTSKPSGGNSGTTHHTLPGDQDTPLIHRSSSDRGISPSGSSSVSANGSSGSASSGNGAAASSSKNGEASSSTKKSNVPGTGDASQAELWLALMLLAAGAAVLVFLRASRRHRKQ